MRLLWDQTHYSPVVCHEPGLMQWKSFALVFCLQATFTVPRRRIQV
jgi:hypothetical protein